MTLKELRAKIQTWEQSFIRAAQDRGIASDELLFINANLAELDLLSYASAEEQEKDDAGK